MGYFEIIKGSGPVIAAAIHSGHLVRDDVIDKFCITDDERLREEDPFTDKFIEFAPTRIIVNSSRFEFDLNRAESKAIYLNPEDAWGLKIWNEMPLQNCTDDSILFYKKFYEEMKSLIEEYVNKYKKIFIYDVHSYNHMRNGPDSSPEDPLKNPDVNIGSANIDNIYWRELIDDLMRDLSEFDFNGNKLDVRENVKFKGGNFSKWIYQNFGNDVCVLSIEFKKIFMNEWTGEAYEDKVELIKEALETTKTGVLVNLEKAQLKEQG